MDQKTVQELISLVKTASENLWEAGYARAQAIIITNAMWIVLLLLAIAVAAWLARYAARKYGTYASEYENHPHDGRLGLSSFELKEQKANWEIALWASVVCIGFLVLIVAIFATATVRDVVSIDYVAIEQLMLLVK